MKLLNSFKKEKLREIHYNGGIVNFFIPQDWKEEAEEDGVCFYEDSPQSGTLRLKIITMKAPHPVTDKDAEKIISASHTLNSNSSKVERLPNGSALIQYTKTAKEEGHDLFLTFWSIANVVPPDHARIATFSYTILEGQKRDKKIIKEIELLGKEIRKVTFANELGL